ncbi:MAG: hypothetical protein ABIP30_03595 [Ferruginibacter sp.]
MKSRSIPTFLLCVFLLQFAVTKSTPVSGYSGSFASQNNIQPSPKEMIIRFLKWYKTNLQKANKFPILVKDSADNFMVNTNASDNYLKLLNSSKCLSPRYIAYWRSYFDDQAIGLQSNPVQSGTPAGFDLDFVLVTRQPELILDHVNEARFDTYSLSKNMARIGVSWPKQPGLEYIIELTKNKSGWQIDFISSPN